MRENAKVIVQNPVLTFTVSGQKVKQNLDFFAVTEFSAKGTSPECTVSAKCNGTTTYGMFEMLLENDEVVKDALKRLKPSPAHDFGFCFSKCDKTTPNDYRFGFLCGLSSTGFSLSGLCSASPCFRSYSFS